MWKTPATTLDEKLAAVQAWMRDCEARHEHIKCRPVAYAPLRLVTVGLDGDPIRLVGRNSTAEATKYAALSYCWGESLQLRTTISTLSTFTQEIPSELIPKTWVDAMQIARALRIPHVWIDALCIVQDDEAEWQHEVTEMSTIYQGSQLTITAAQSTDSSQGCVPPSITDSPAGADLFFRTRSNGLDGRSSIVRVYRQDVRVRPGRDTAISSRGWTLQEQLLSPRLALCMQPEIHWQCRASYQTESGLSFEPADILKGNHMLLPRYDCLETGDQEYRRAWRRIIEGYSDRVFSHSKDRIPAVAGIVRHLSSVLDDVSILGLWKKSFAQDLAWLRSDGHSQMADTTGLPSWTWLTAQGSVLYNTKPDYYDHKDTEVVESLRLLDWDVQWKGVPFASAVTLAQVRVEGPVRDIRIVPSPEGNRYKPPYFQVFEEKLQAETPHKIPWRCAGRFDASDPVEAATYLCLLLFSQSFNPGSDDAQEVFLILEPVEMKNGMGPSYKRIGLARIWKGLPVFDATNTMVMLLV